MFGMDEATPGFNDPIGLLRACHRRIAERLELLERLPGYVETHGADASAQSAAQRILNYFERAAEHHHQDEEEDLFPMLRRARGRNGWDERMLDSLDQLTVEHARLAWRWAQARPSLVALVRGQRVPNLRIDELVRAYRAHMAIEDEMIFPRAATLLDPAELQRLGAAMQRRRGLSPAADARDQPD